MSLPKKRKRLDEDQIVEKKRKASPVPDHDMTPMEPHDHVLEVTGRREQMLKAFEMVDHIEHVHGMTVPEGSEQAGPMQNPSLANHTIPVGSDGAPLRTSSRSLPERHFEAHVRAGEADIPVIEMKIKVPELFLRLPLLKDMTMHLLKRLSKE